MEKQANKRTVVLLVDFARKKAGEDFTADGLITTSLVNRKIARYKTEEELQKQSETVITSGDGKVTKMKAADLIAKIKEADSVETVDALITEDEDRATVLSAAEARKKELGEGAQQ